MGEAMKNPMIIWMLPQRSMDDHLPGVNFLKLTPQNSMMWHKTVFDWFEKYIGNGAKGNLR